MKIRRYNPDSDEEKLLSMIKAEREEWACYSAGDVLEKYKRALIKSITYVAYKDNVLCGYSRSMNDCGFYIYVCDLLVAPKYRGNHIGRKLIECLLDDFPMQTVYVMSDVDEYYNKQNYKLEGSIFRVPNLISRKKSDPTTY